jgi:hypothetical protein
MKYLLFTFLLFLSIWNKENDDPVLSNFKKSGDLQCTLTSIKRSDIGIVVDISVIDSFLILSEHQTDLIFKVFSIKTGRLISNSIRRGIGPDEINFPTDISEYQNDVFTMYDAGLKKIDFLSVNNMTKGNAKFLKSEKIPYSAFKTYPLNDSIFLSTGTFEEGRYSLYNKNTSKNKVMLDYPFDAKHKNESNLIKGFAFQGEIAIKPDLKKFVSTSNSAGNIEICELHNDKIERVFRKDYFLPEYKNIGIAAAFLKNNRFAFHSPSVTDDNIYVIYSGKSAESPHYTSGKFLLVYDWSGTPLIYFNLDRGIDKMALDRKNNTIYCVSMNPDSYEDEIVSYKLPKF